MNSLHIIESIAAGSPNTSIQMNSHQRQKEQSAAHADNESEAGASALSRKILDTKGTQSLGNYTESSRPDDDNDDISEHSQAPSNNRRMRPAKKESGYVIDRRAIQSAKRRLDYAKSTANSQTGVKSSSRHFQEKTKSDNVSLSNAGGASMSGYN